MQVFLTNEDLQQSAMDWMICNKRGIYEILQKGLGIQHEVMALQINKILTKITTNGSMARA